MDFVSNRQPQIEEMLEAIGAKSVEELFQSIPATLIRKAPEVDDGLSELEGMRLMEALSKRNTFPALDSYLGAGAYEHHVPALVSSITSRGEFLTSYTPIKQKPLKVCCKPFSNFKQLFAPSLDLMLQAPLFTMGPLLLLKLYLWRFALKVSGAKLSSQKRYILTI
jgi:hypothetical protein